MENSTPLSNQQKEEQGRSPKKGPYFVQSIKRLLFPLDAKSAELRLVWAAYLIKSLLCAAFSFFISRTELFLGLYPIGIAFCSAATKYIPALLLGSVLSGVSSSGFDTLIGTALSLCVRFGIGYYLYYDMPSEPHLLPPRTTADAPKKPRVFGESIYLRMASGTIGAFVVSMVRIISARDPGSDITAAILMLFSVPCLVFLFSGLWEKKRSGVLWEAAVATVCFVSVFAASSLRTGGISLGVALAFLLTLYISREGGLLRGGMLGLIMGFACYPQYASLFAFCGFAAGIFFSAGIYPAVGIACAIAIFFGSYVGGFAALRTLLPSVFSAAVVFLALHGIKALPKIKIYKSAVIEAAKEQLSPAYNRAELMQSDINSLSCALKSLSSSFFELSERFRRPGISEISACVEGVCNEHCSRCPSHYLCWDRERKRTEDYYGALAGSVYAGGRALDVALPEYMQRCCHRTEQIHAEIERRAFVKFEESLKLDKSEIFAHDYECMAKMLDYLIEKSTRDTELNPALTKKASAAAEHLAAPLDGIAVFGERRLKIVAGGVDPSSKSFSAAKIRTGLETAIGRRFGEPRFNIDDGYTTMVLDGSACFEVNYAVAGAKKKHERENGDDICIFRGGAEQFYSVLCDGMGSGSEAHLTSSLATRFFEAMLTGGGNKEIATEMLNTFLRTKKTECATTVDLLEIDLITGRASFLKSGAAPSMVVRDKNIFKLSCQSAPIGVMRGIRAEKIDFDLKSGDTIVMFSDGIAQNFEESIRLAELLSEDDLPREPDELARHILQSSKQNEQKSDDMTVAVINVTKI